MIYRRVAFVFNPLTISWQYQLHLAVSWFSLDQCVRPLFVIKDALGVDSQQFDDVLKE